MKAIIPIFFVTLVIGLTYVSARIGFFHGTRPKRMTNPERRELESLRNLRDDLQDMAAEHIAIGDPFAAIVSDTIRQQKRELK